MPVQTRRVDKHKFQVFWRKAAEFHRQMKGAESDSLWNAASLNGIHCAISSADALCVYFLGERSASQRHEDACRLVRSVPLPGADERAKQLVDVVGLKNLVEYSDDEPTEKEARRIILQADRFFSWVKTCLRV